MQTGPFSVLVDEDGRVCIQKTPPLDLEYLRSTSSTLSEWDSQEDEEAFRCLQDL